MVLGSGFDCVDQWWWFDCVGQWWSDLGLIVLMVVVLGFGFDCSSRKPNWLG